MPIGAWHIEQMTKAHCVKGHLYDEVNTYYHRGHRQCRTCKHNRMVKWWAENKGRDFSHRPKVVITEKRCSNCKETKPIEEFSPCKARKDSHQYVCKLCMRSYKNARYHANPKAHYQRAKEYYARHPEKRRETVRNYKSANLDKLVNWQGKRKALKKGNGWEKVDTVKVFERDNGICHICKLPVDPKNWHLDHVVPIIKGGSHTYNNVAVSHPKCNLSKGAKLIAA